MDLDDSDYITIPTTIDSNRTIHSSALVPKHIIQTFKTNRIHKAVYDNIAKILDLNDDYTYYLVTDEIGVELIRKYFDTRTYDAFMKLKVGSAKGDFLRYIALYVYGGVYIDMDSSILIKLRDFIPNNIDYVFFYKFTNYVAITQWCLISKPREPIYSKIIHEMVTRIHNNEGNIFIATGPILVTDCVYNALNNTNIYNVLKCTHIFERKIFFNNLSKSNTTRNCMYIDTCEITDKFKFRFDGYENEMLYDTENKYSGTGSIYDIPSAVESKFVYVNRLTDMDLYTKSKQILCNYVDQHILFDKYNEIVDCLLDGLRENSTVSEDVKHEILVKTRDVQTQLNDMFHRNKTDIYFLNENIYFDYII